jgi:hypothetical protein
VSRDDNDRIAKAFTRHVTPDESDVDHQLFEIRRLLEAQHGTTFNFYGSVFKALWKQGQPTEMPPHVSPQSDAAGSNDASIAAELLLPVAFNRKCGLVVAVMGFWA